MDAQERAAFLQWRRALAAVEEAERLVLTPFEKNLEVWRQLWRVVERSHIVVQVGLLSILNICEARGFCLGLRGPCLCHALPPICAEITQACEGGCSYMKLEAAAVTSSAPCGLQLFKLRPALQAK